MRTLTTLGLAAIALFAVACSDDTTNPEPTAPDVYVVSTTGSCVVHSNVNVAIDAVTKATTQEPAADDSTVVVSASTTNGTTTSTAHVYVNGQVADTVVMMQNGTVVMQEFPLQYTIQAFNLDLGKKNVTVLDQNATSWTALKDSIPPFDFPGMPQYKITAALNFTGKKLGTESVTLNGATVSTQKVQLDLDATLYLAAGPTQIPLPVKLVRTLWFAKGVGIVKAEQQAAVIDLGIVGGFLGTPVQAVPGFVQTAKTWSIK